MAEYKSKLSKTEVWGVAMYMLLLWMSRMVIGALSAIVVREF